MQSILVFFRDISVQEVGDTELAVQLVMSDRVMLIDEIHTCSKETP